MSLIVLYVFTNIFQRLIVACKKVISNDKKHIDVIMFDMKWPCSVDRIKREIHLVQILVHSEPLAKNDMFNVGFLLFKEFVTALNIHANISCPFIGRTYSGLIELRKPYKLTNEI